MDRDDVLGLGPVGLDEVLVVAAYPPADAKIRVLRREVCLGGLTGTALVAAARLGSRCAYAGTLGTDDRADRVLDILARYGVRVATTRRRAGVGPVLSTVVVSRADASRTVFSDPNGFTGPDVDWPPPEVIGAARVLLVDHVGVPGMTRAATIARAAGVAVVADFERTTDPGLPALLGLADHLIVGRAFASAWTGLADPADAARGLRAEGRAAVVVTGGAEGCWACDGPEGAPRHLPAFKVEARDTTGCGDVFHGAYASALARGESFGDRLRIASAAAALKAAGAGIPDLAAVLEISRGYL